MGLKIPNLPFQFFSGRQYNFYFFYPKETFEFQNFKFFHIFSISGPVIQFSFCTNIQFVCLTPFTIPCIYCPPSLSLFVLASLQKKIEMVWAERKTVLIKIVASHCNVVCKVVYFKWTLYFVKHSKLQRPFVLKKNILTTYIISYKINLASKSC